MLTSHAAVASNMAERLLRLGGIVPARVRLSPPPGTATIEELQAVNRHTSPLCELIDHTLVEKALSFAATVVAAAFDGGHVLPGFTCPFADFFTDLDPR